ncbi:hypothetical protein E2C01_095107 [Portunus trituberculatus]|uniref:Uncharacterized protein n=1 Tax=Portunus trituberculatus TaxID=210409 RepID=A0A5B7JXY1_PORTR|nr:hypothetical protein [Portunus trituberculatus]
MQPPGESMLGKSRTTTGGSPAEEGETSDSLRRGMMARTLVLTALYLGVLAVGGEVTDTGVYKAAIKVRLW